MQRIVRRGSGMTGSAAFTGMSARMSTLLRSRGIHTEAEASAYLNPSLAQRHDPMLLHDMDKALRLLADAKREGRRFIVYGDYDVDGICATAIMVQALTQYGLRAPDYPTMYRIPDRHEEGYGLNEEAVHDLIGKADILITVDCGITSMKEVALAEKAGMQVIVTDHHALPDELPPADAVIDPLMPPYPFPGLCGAGVAYQLCRALLGDEAAKDCLDLAALATVADMVPLKDENRAIVALGLKAIEHTRRPGLRALMRAAAFKPPLRSEHIAFGLAPRMNACGRLKSALMAVRLLFEQDEAAADQIAFEMNRLNEQRKEEERAVLNDAQAQLEGMDLCRLRAIVICGQGYDSGVVGLAAGRLAERYGYPTVVLADQGEFSVGSARSVPGIDIYQALKTCSDLFMRFGGHPQAAGMTLRTDDVPEFRERLSKAVSEQLDGQALMPVLLYDDELELAEVNEATVGVLQGMEPFGLANPAPVFYGRDVSLVSLRTVGQEGLHLKCELEQDGVHRAGIAFRQGMLARRPPEKADVLFVPVRNEFRGDVTYECQISRIIPAAAQISCGEADETEANLRELMFAVEEDLPEDDIQPADTWPDSIPEQGTLVLCRFAETARAWQKRYPQLDARFDPYSDPCAYSSVALGLTLWDIRAPYRRVILADGSLTGMDHGLAARRFPQARITLRPESGELRKWLTACALDRNCLRALYKALRDTRRPAGIGIAASAAGLNISQAITGALILEQMDLIDYDSQKRTWTMKPPVKREPETSLLYRLLQARKEGEQWRTPLMNR